MTTADSAWARFRTSRWRILTWLTPVIIVLAFVLVFVARWLRTLPEVQAWMGEYPGEYHSPVPVAEGIPVWAAWQHFFNIFLMVLVVRTGLQVRNTRRPPGFWTRTNKGVIRTKRPPRKISLQLWLHNALDVLWVLNGVIFIVLLFVTGHWVRIVPTSWEVIPNALSAMLQYVSFDWPTENGWVNYNSLQQLSYFGVVFLLAPLAILTGLRMAEFWPTESKLNKVFKVELARAVHFPVMLLFVLFTLIHVILVLATGAQRNLNHMFAATDDPGSWLGVIFFAVGMLVVAGAVIAAQPMVYRPIAQLFGKVSR